MVGAAVGAVLGCCVGLVGLTVGAGVGVVGLAVGAGVGVPAPAPVPAEPTAAR